MRSLKNLSVIVAAILVTAGVVALSLYGWSRYSASKVKCEDILVPPRLAQAKRDLDDASQRSLKEGSRAAQEGAKRAARKYVEAVEEAKKSQKPQDAGAAAAYAACKRNQAGGSKKALKQK